MTTQHQLPPGTYHRGSVCPACGGRWFTGFTVMSGDTVNCSCGASVRILTHPSPNIEVSRWPSPRAIIITTLALFYLSAYVIGIVLASGPGRAEAIDVAFGGGMIALGLIFTYLVYRANRD